MVAVAFKYLNMTPGQHVLLPTKSSGHSVAMVTYSVTKIIPTCSRVIGQFFDTMIVASIDKEWL